MKCLKAFLVMGAVASFLLAVLWTFMPPTCALADAIAKGGTVILFTGMDYTTTTSTTTTTVPSILVSGSGSNPSITGVYTNNGGTYNDTNYWSSGSWFLWHGVSAWYVSATLGSGTGSLWQNGNQARNNLYYPTNAATGTVVVTEYPSPYPADSKIASGTGINPDCTGVYTNAGTYNGTNLWANVTGNGYLLGNDGIQGYRIAISLDNATHGWVQLGGTVFNGNYTPITPLYQTGTVTVTDYTP